MSIHLHMCTQDNICDEVCCVIQFVLLMDQPSMKVEWRCITMVYGGQCVMMDGI